MAAGKIGVVIHLGTNPVYNLSPEYKYDEAVKKVPMSITLMEQLNETSEISNYVLPVHNPLESWGDYKTRTGFYSMQQPIIAPLYNTRQKEAIILSWKEPKEFSETLYRDYLISNWEKTIYPAYWFTAPFKKFWNSILHDGVVFINEKPEAAVGAFAVDAFASGAKMKASSDFVVMLQDNNNVGDGRFASNGWLQELPNPVTKIVWDNYAAISAQSASELGVDSDDTIDITIGSRKQTFPVYVQPGIADKTIEISLGYGRTAAGVIGTGIGVNANVLIGKDSGIKRKAI